MTLNYPNRQRQLEKLVQKFGLPAQISLKWELLDLALTHPSVSPDSNYQQLEFVGDAVVRLAAAEFLFEHYPECPVGEFAAIRSVLVSDRSLAKIADCYGFDRYLLLSPSAASDTDGQQSRLADSLEAVLAALYLSTHTLALVRPWLDSHFHQLAEEIRTDPARQNYKAALQEWTQARYKALPEYRVRETGHGKGDPHRFTAEVFLQGKQLGKGIGRSIKAAEQAAAREAFDLLRAQQPLLSKQGCRA